MGEVMWDAGSTDHLPTGCPRASRHACNLHCTRLEPAKPLTAWFTQVGAARDATTRLWRLSRGVTTIPLDLAYDLLLDFESISKLLTMQPY